MENDHTNLYAIGAFDRPNYGDFLLPVIAKKYLEEHYPSVSVKAYALVSSDYSRYGALKTKPIKDLYKKGFLKDGDIIYFAGGGTIGSSWYDMHSNLVNPAAATALYYLQRLTDRRLANYLSRYYLGGRSPFPWIVSPDDFPAQVKVIYNSVGGSEFSKLDLEIQKAILSKLSDATYLSVRDAETKKLIAPVEARIPVYLAPDFATIMSKEFPLEDLVQIVSAFAKDIVSRGDYVCFQGNSGYIRKNIAEITKQLQYIYDNSGLRTVLIPIGGYSGLDDSIGLKEIKNSMRAPVHLIERYPSIWDVMYIIANAKLFLGTSLHGNITAQSFAVPHIGLSQRRCKLDFYLETWDIPEYARCIPINETGKAFEKIMTCSIDVLQKNRDELIRLACGNMESMIAMSLKT